MAVRTTITPVLPSELEALLPSGQEPLCSVMVKFFLWQLLYWRWHTYAFTNGEMTEAFIAEVCFAVKFCGEPQVKNPESPFYEPPEE